MKTSKRKRSPKSEPAAEAAVALDSAPAAASAEPAPVEVVATESANDPVVAEAVVPEPVTAVVVAAEAVAPESVVDEAVAAEPVAAEAAASESVVTEAVVTGELAAAEASEPVAEAVVAESEPVAAEAATAVEPVVVLAANCSVKDAAALKTSLCAVANESAAVTLDASAVERVDTATMQLLCAFARDRSARNQSIVWRGQSQALNDAVRLLGVAALIGFDANGVAA